jgi:hypothetical protein
VQPEPSPRPYVMSRARARWMGVLAILPPAFFALMFVGFFATLASATGRQGAPPPAPPALVLAIFPLQCVMIPAWIAGMVLYVLDVFRNPHVPENLRPVWVLLFFFIGMLTMPVYWFLYLWQPLRRAPGAPAP